MKKQYFNDLYPNFLKECRNWKFLMERRGGKWVIVKDVTKGEKR